MGVREAPAGYRFDQVPVTDADDVPPGYKRTEVGVIPEDWTVESLDSLAFVTSGKRMPLGFLLTDNETPHPYVRVVDMRPGTVSLDDIKFVPTEAFPAIRRYRIFTGDIFISVAGTLGIVGKVPDALDGANLTENADRITEIKCSRDFLLNILASPLVQNTIDALRTVGAQPKLALERIRKFEIPLPPTEAEQEAIADALSDTDALIESLQQLIAKQRAIKQGAMQALLTGRQRLPGFSGEWQGRVLQDVATIDSGINKPVASMGQGSLYVTVQDLYAGNVIDVAGLGRIDVSRGEIERFRLLEGDIVFGKSSVKREGIGYPSRFAGCAEPVVPSGFTYRVRPYPQLVDSVFLLNALRLDSTRAWVVDNAQASALTNINRSIAGAVPVFLPEQAEQTAIAAILSDMDAAIDALEARLAKTRALKAGMMQQLLTGWIRLRDRIP